MLWAAGQHALFGMDLANGYGLAETVQAVEMAEATGAAVLGRALSMRHLVDVFARPERAVEPLRHARDVATAAGDRFGTAFATIWLAMTATFGLDEDRPRAIAQHQGEKNGAAHHQRHRNKDRSPGQQHRDPNAAEADLTEPQPIDV